MRRANILVVTVLTFLAACSPPPTSSDVQRDRQETMVADGVAQVGVPAIKNFREYKLAKDIYEMRDQTGLVTYTYLWSDINGKLIFFCDSIGYPIPYATQFSAPESVQRFYLPARGNAPREWGKETLPQAEPNGLFTPGSAEGTWVMCKDPGGKETRPTYVEPRVIVTQFKLNIE
jgi:hypothetical protein